MTRLNDDFSAVQEPSRDEFQRVVLDVLIGKAEKTAIKRMLDCGADPDAKTNDGFPMLTLVSKDKELMQMLLDAGADIDATCAGWTTLMRAAYTGQDETVRFLIKAGASPDCTTEDGRTILQLVQEQDNPGLATVEALLLDAIEIRSRSAMRTDDLKPEEKPAPAALIQAVYEDNGPAVQGLLERGADANEKDEGGKTPLIQAARLGRTDIVRLLLDAGAVVDEKDGGGRSALMWAAVLDQVDCARELVKRQADVNGRYNDGATPLIQAASKGFEDMTRLLIDGGAFLDVRANNYAGFTALIMAAAREHAGIVRLLADAGAGLDVTDRSGFTALASVDRPEGMNSARAKIIEILKSAPDKRRHAAVARKQQYLQAGAKKLNLRPAP